MTHQTTEIVKKSLPARYRRERIFRAFGLSAVILGAVFVVILFTSILSKGISAFHTHYVRLPIYFSEKIIDPAGTRKAEELARANYKKLISTSLYGLFPKETKRSQKKVLRSLISTSASFDLQHLVIAEPSLIGQKQELWFQIDDEGDNYFKGHVSKTKVINLEGRPEHITNDGTQLVIQTTERTLIAVRESLVKNIEEELKAIERLKLRATNNLQDQQEILSGQKDLLEEATNYDVPSRIKRFSEMIQATEAEISDIETDLALINEKITTYKQIIKGDQRTIAIPETTSSYLLMLNGGSARVTEIGKGSIKADVLTPFSDEASDDWSIKIILTSENDRKVSDKRIALLDKLSALGRVESRFNSPFFTNGDSRDPEQAGIAGALMGSALTLIATLLLSFPIGVGAAIYLEEFAPQNKLTDLIEVNINNLAAVPSIVFGLLGLAVFINFFGMPRSAPVVGGLVLTLMTLPTIIIASRAAIKSVPPSIKEAALGVGASKMQAIFHHVLPLALPGMLTGTIIGMAQALGETAPLLMIGMVAFIVDIPQGFTDNATVLPVQIYLWSDSPERAFVEKTSAAIMVLLAFLISMNALAVYLRKKFERKW